MSKVTTTEKKYICQECQNSNDLSESEKQIKDIVECNYCGMEYTIVEVSDVNGPKEYVLEELVEKK